MPVANVFVDEAGDLGFTTGSSQSYVIGYVITELTPFKIRKDCVRLLREINKKLKPKSKLTEFKFSSDRHETRMKVLKLISSSDLDIGIVAIRKDSVSSPELRQNPNALYNYLAAHHIVPVLVTHYLKSTMPVNRIRFKIDQSLSKTGRKKFDEYFDKKLSYVKYSEKFKNDIMAEIEHENSHNDVCLQIADYVASSFFRKIEKQESQYYDVIKNKIKHRDKWDWHNKINW